MAPWAGEKLLQVCANTASILAIELLVAAHAIDCMQPRRTTPELQAVHARIRQEVPFVRADHRLDGHIAVLTRMVGDGAFADG
jgi:histidine ammonia-lyase